MHVINERYTQCDLPGCDGVHTPNLPLLRKVVAEIEAHPETWRQQSWTHIELDSPPKMNGMAWDSTPMAVLTVDPTQPQYSCKTAFCVAGHVGVMTGWSPKFYMFANNTDADGTDMVNEDGVVFNVAEIAQHELGLTNDEADELFDGGNTLEQIYAVCRELAAVVGEEF